MSKKKIVKSRLFRTLFAVSIVGTISFSTLFFTQVTPPDMNHFIVSAKKTGSNLITSAKNMKILAKKDINLPSLKTKTVAKKTRPKQPKKETAQTVQDTVLENGIHDIIYYSQADNRWRDKIYGEDNTIGIYGCGPTTLAMLVSSLTSTKTTPDQMAAWAYDNGYFCKNSGSYHTIIPGGGDQFGLSVTSISDHSPENIINELSSGKVVVVLMKKGHFTSEGHFVILRGITKNSEILIADSKSLENSCKGWDINIFMNEAKYSCTGGGPFWAIDIK